jgi:dTDP-3-amino-2,3,6-trideoxy-4-keto-D-glucose/dTDP-3-amino-3,4,6-trideoxy-alpha-D-glucose/dTDP-2,6-dideoxy-D-kanosamine transaminase
MNTRPIPVNDLRRHTDAIAGELTAAIGRVIARGWFVLGPEVEAFEQEFGAYCGVAHCIGVASGTDALELALRGLGIGPGDQVATVANAGMYSTVAIRAIGAIPVYVEISASNLIVDPDALAAALTPHVRAVIITHLYGQMADMPRVLDVARGASVPVIEDCAQAHGAVLHGKRAGSWGDAGCFSFYPTKNLGALGDGGAVVTANGEMARRLRSLRQYGWTTKYRSTVGGGINSRLDEVQAAVLRAKLPYLDGWNSKRRAIAQAYCERLNPLGVWPAFGPGADYVAHLCVIRTPRRDELGASLRETNIGTDIHYPVPDYAQESCLDLGYRPDCLPVTEAACREVLTLPCFPELRPSELSAILDRVQHFLGQPAEL